jgi:hypothetical protein
MTKVYGYIYASVFHETGLTEKGAKIAASKCGTWGNDGGLLVGYRSPINNMFIPTSRKYSNTRWLKVD